MPIRLVLTDLDGTLLDPERHISDEAVETIAELGRRGILFTFITGRPWYAAERFAVRAGVELPIITCNGGALHQGAAVLERHSMSIFALRPLFERAAEAGMTLLCSAEGREFGMTDTGWTRQRDYAVHWPTDREWQELRADKLNIIPGEHNAAFRDLFPVMDALAEQYEIVRYGDTGCEITAKGVHKAAALERYAGRFQIPLEDVLAIGDNENDIQMLQLAGTGAAVANATPAAKAAADYICTRNNTGGVVEAVRRFCLGEVGE